MKSLLHHIDTYLIHGSQRVQYPLARVALFVVFFWFGILKVLGTSPANPLVESLLTQTMPWWSFDSFIVLFGLFEMLIGVVFLVPGFERLAIGLLAFHMVTTFMPTVLLPEIAWSGFLTPTLEGQYMIKNVVIIALAVGIAAHIRVHHKEES